MMPYNLVNLREDNFDLLQLRQYKKDFHQTYHYNALKYDLNNLWF